MQPGQTIAPQADQPPENQQQPEPAPTPPEHDTPPAAPEPETTWQFKPASGAPQAVAPAPQIDPVSWSASEYVAHHKNAGWFLLVGLAIVALAASIYAATKDRVATVVIGVAGMTFVAFGARKPQVLKYVVDNKGIHIGPNSYPYDIFRSFSVLEDGAVHSILLMPSRRTGLPIAIYYELKDEVSIVTAIGASLPLEERQPAAIDRLMSKIRF